MTTLVIAPIPQEFEVLATAFEQRWGSPERREVGKTDVYEYRATDVILAQGGLGKVQFAVTTGHLLDHLPKVNLVVCAGVAGALTESVLVADVVVGTATVEHDFNPTSFHGQLPTFNASTPHVAELRHRAVRESFEVHFAPVASGDEAIGDPVRAGELHSRAGALAVAWEGAGGARAAAFSEVPYVEVRGISDMADHAAQDVWEANIPAAMRNVASIVAWLAEHPIPAPDAEPAE